MGRTTDTKFPPTPQGVRIRTDFVDGPRLQIAFSYEGQECRELLPPGRITKAYIEYATGLRAEIRRKIKDGAFVYADYFPDSSQAVKSEQPVETRLLTLGQLLTTQKALYEKQVENDSLSASTLLGYIKAIDHQLLPKWKDTELHALTPAELRLWISTMNVTAKTVRNRLTPLRSVLDDAVNDELIAFNPLDRIKLGKLLKQTAKKSGYVVDPFDRQEIEAMLKAARVDERPLVQFWFESGLRPGEMMAVSWERVDWIHRRVRIEDNIVTGLVEGKVQQVHKKPKTDAGIREVELSERAMQALKDQKAYTFLAGERIWHDPRKNAPWESEGQIRKSLWEPLCKRAGVRYRNPYQARHTFASTRLTDGANPWWMADQLGHEDVEMVYKIYGKFIASNFQRSGRFAQNSHREEVEPLTKTINE